MSIKRGHWCYCMGYYPGAHSLTIFARNSNSMETTPCCNSVTGHQIATNFCPCHGSTAVVPCTTFLSDHCIGIEMRAKCNFHRIWIGMEKPLVKRSPGILISFRPCQDITWRMIPYRIHLCIPNLQMQCIDLNKWQNAIVQVIISARCDIIYCKETELCKLITG